jgi:hypothetical protein
MTPTGYHDATFYAQVEPTWSYGRDRNGDHTVNGAKVVGLTQKTPDNPRRGVIVTKLTIRIPDAAFMPLRPEAIVVIPAEMTAPWPVEVTAEDANGDAA